MTQAPAETYGCTGWSYISHHKVCNEAAYWTHPAGEHQTAQVIKARRLFTASLTTKTCLSAKIYRALGSKVCRWAKETRRDENQQGARHTDAPILCWTQHNSINNQIQKEVTHWEKRHFLQLQRGENVGRGPYLLQPLKDICELFTFLKQKNHQTKRYRSYERLEGKILKCFDCKSYLKTYKLSLKEVDVKSKRSGSKGWSLNLMYEMTVNISHLSFNSAKSLIVHRCY